KRDDRSDTCIFGAAQLAWLKRELVASDATWKVIAADMPIGLVSEDAIALGDGPPERREHEIADLLSFMKRAGIRNTVWLTADMHGRRQSRPLVGRYRTPPRREARPDHRAAHLTRSIGRPAAQNPR